MQERKQGLGCSGYWTPIDAFNQLWKINKDKKKIGLDRLGVLWLIERYSASKSVGCWRTCNSIAKELGVSREHVARTIKEFVEWGLIVRLGEATIGNIMRPMWATCFTDKWMFHSQETQEGPPRLRSGKDWEKAARKVIRKWNRGTRKDDNGDRLSVKIVHNPKAFSNLFLKKFRKDNNKSFKNDKDSDGCDSITASCNGAITASCNGAITQSNMKKTVKRKQTLSSASRNDGVCGNNSPSRGIPSAKKKPSSSDPDWTGNDTNTKSTVSKSADKYTNLLWRKVQRNFPNVVNWKRSSKSKWAESFDRRSKGRDRKEIKRLLKVHIDHMGEPYWPEAYCMETFFDKMEEIAKAEIRSKNKKVSGIKSNELSDEEKY